MTRYAKKMVRPDFYGNEQSYHYHDYLSKCQMRLRYLIECGDGIGDTNFILQENDDFLLQEDGYKLIWKL
jgi:hypothetical protein